SARAALSLHDALPIWICRLALLKHDASLPELTEKQEQQAARLLEEFIQQNLRFAFYQKLPAQLIKSYQLEDKIFVEEKLPAAARSEEHTSELQSRFDL